MGLQVLDGRRLGRRFPGLGERTLAQPGGQQPQQRHDRASALHGSRRLRWGARERGARCRRAGIIRMSRLVVDGGEGELRLDPVAPQPLLLLLEARMASAASALLWAASATASRTCRAPRRCCSALTRPREMTGLRPAVASRPLCELGPAPCAWRQRAIQMRRSCLRSVHDRAAKSLRPSDRAALPGPWPAAHAASRKPACPGRGRAWPERAARAPTRSRSPRRGEGRDIARAPPPAPAELRESRRAAAAGSRACRKLNSASTLGRRAPRRRGGAPRSSPGRHPCWSTIASSMRPMSFRSR